MEDGEITGEQREEIWRNRDIPRQKEYERGKKLRQTPGGKQIEYIQTTLPTFNFLLPTYITTGSAQVTHLGRVLLKSWRCKALIINRGH